MSRMGASALIRSASLVCIDRRKPSREGAAVSPAAVDSGGTPLAIARAVMIATALSSMVSSHSLIMVPPIRKWSAFSE